VYSKVGKFRSEISLKIEVSKILQYIWHTCVGSWRCSWIKKKSKEQRWGWVSAHSPMTLEVFQFHFSSSCSLVCFWTWTLIVFLEFSCDIVKSCVPWNPRFQLLSDRKIAARWESRHRHSDQTHMKSSLIFENTIRIENVTLC
jgi:hypothetical protein